MRAACTALLLGGCFPPYGGGTVPPPEAPPPEPEAQPAPAPDARIEDEEPSLPRRTREPRTITLHVLADERVRLDSDWRKKAEIAAGLASQPFRSLDIAFKVVSTGHWETPAGEDSLSLLLDRAAQQPKAQAEVVVAMVGGTGALPDLTDDIGRAQYPEDVTVVRWAAPETLGRVLAHELGHLLGAVHVEQPGSLMRASYAQAGAELDRYNTELVDANRGRGFARDRPPLTEQEADWALDAVRRLLRDDRHNRDAEDMRTLLHEYKIRLKAWQSEAGIEDEEAARRKSALSLVEEARRHFGAGKRGKALAFLREALRTDPECPGAHMELGKDLFAQGKTEEALAEFFAEVKVSPESAEAFYNIGLCHDREGRADQALEAFQTALRFDPNHAQAREKVGSAE